jgi:hypothetical protein
MFSLVHSSFLVSLDDFFSTISASGNLRSFYLLAPRMAADFHQMSLILHRFQSSATSHTFNFITKGFINHSLKPMAWLEMWIQEAHFIRVNIAANLISWSSCGRLSLF